MMNYKRKQQLQPLNLITCVNEVDAIGKEGNLLYRISQDFEWFKEVTKGQIVVMGVKTYKEIGRPLPGRVNIVVYDESRPEPEVAPGVILAGSLDEALFISAFEVEKEIFIIGGASLYREAFDYEVDYVFRTVVHDRMEGDQHFVTTDELESRFHLENETPDIYEGINRVSGESVQYQFEIWKKQNETTSRAYKAKMWLDAQKGVSVSGYTGARKTI